MIYTVVSPKCHTKVVVFLVVLFKDDTYFVCTSTQITKESTLAQ